MKFEFREKKATQAAALFLQLRGGAMNHMKLIKLLYILDREALLRWGAPVTFDRFVSMNNGPVLSSVLDRINAQVDPAHCTYWHEYISERRRNTVKLKEFAGTDELSQAELNLAKEIYEEHGRRNRWDLVEFVHTFPEWEHPHGSARPISYRSILEQGDYSPEEIDLIEEELRSVALADALFGR